MSLQRETGRPGLRGPEWDSNKRGLKTAERLAHQIVRDIVSDHLQPGDRLAPEAEMVRTYKVARGTLREAMRILEVQGLISMKPGPGGGPVVTALTAYDFASMAKLHFQWRGSSYRELLDARLAIEPVAARLAAERQDPEGMALLRELIVDSQRSDESSWQQTSDEFHDLVGEMSGNTVIDLLGSSMRVLYHARIEGSMPSPKLRRDIVAAHAEIAEAIYAGRGDDAERLMREHMDQYSKRSEKTHAVSLDEHIKWA